MPCFSTRSLSLLTAATIGVGLLHGPAALAQTSLTGVSGMDNAVSASPDEQMHVKVWLTPKNRTEMDETAAKLYEQGSSTYHKFLKPSDLARFAPSAADVATVKQELTAKGLTVRPTKANAMYLEADGKVSALETAFQTQIKTMQVKGQVVHAATQKPKLSGAAGSLILGVSGLTDGFAKPTLVHPINPDTGKPYAPVALASPAGVFYASNCFTGVTSATFKTPGAALPLATYTGNRYGANIGNTTLGTLPPCGYGAVNYSKAYGMNAAYNKGLNGGGQTIVIVDAYGSPTIQTDANLFSEVNNLPALTASNFQVIYPLGAPKPTSAANAAGWAEETSLDVEWAHALAPGANIILLVAPSNSFGDLFPSVSYAIQNGLGSVISNSYSGAEIFDVLYAPDTLILSNLISEMGALTGISVNYSSGDDGDLLASIGVKSVSDLGDSPYATSVGGTSLAVTTGSTRMFETGWGGNLTKLASGTNGAPLVPPLHEGFFAGSGGGESIYFGKPSWQTGVPGNLRQQPDVSLDADPYTGVEFIHSIDGVAYVTVIGGTSLSCPAFSGIWAIANQRAAQIYGPGTLLGQAAPTVARLAGTSAVTDVLPYSSATNPAGVIFTSSGAEYQSASELAQPLDGTTEFYGALYNSPYSKSWFELTFGTDSSLRVTQGWDNVTGYGTPNGLPFIEAAAQ